MAEKIVGQVQAQLFARIGEGTEEVPLGIAYMPIVISQSNVRKLQVDLTQPFEVAKASLEAIYAAPEPAPNVATAPPATPTLADLASPGAAARKREAKRLEETPKDYDPFSDEVLNGNPSLEADW
jgi:hypothetical protein